MAIRPVEVDCNIAPVIEWLQSFDGITTRWSCEGVDAQDVEYGAQFEHYPDAFVTDYKPYVVFYCDVTLSLIRVVERLKDYATVEVRYYAEGGGLRYIATFADKQQLVQMIRTLNLGYTS